MGNIQGNAVSAMADLPSTNGTFYIEILNNSGLVHIMLLTGAYLQAASQSQLTADYSGTPGWDNNSATFQMIIVANNLHGDFQLANGYGHMKAKEILQYRDIETASSRCKISISCTNME